MQLLVTDASASSLKTIDSQVATFRRITQVELDVSLMAELEEILEKLRRCVLNMCTLSFVFLFIEDLLDTVKTKLDFSFTCCPCLFI